MSEGTCKLPKLIDTGQNNDKLINGYDKMGYLVQSDLQFNDRIVAFGKITHVLTSPLTEQPIDTCVTDSLSRVTKEISITDEQKLNQSFFCQSY